MKLFVDSRFWRAVRFCGAHCVWGLMLLSCASGSESMDAGGEPPQDEGKDDTISLGPGAGGDMAQGGSGAIPVPNEMGHADDACLRFMSWGKASQAGAVPGESGMDAIVTWLNRSSTAAGAHYPEKPQITAEFLDFFDVLLLQNIETWDISQDERELLRQWVQAGGGVMALSGYTGDTAQVLATNRLLSFSGINYVSITEPDTALSLGACGYCLGSAHKQEGFNTQHPVAEGVSAVGAFEGRSIGGSGAIVAQEQGKILGMTAEVGEGRVFFFHDDWVTYFGLWSQNAPSACSENTKCSSVSPTTTFQMSRFWFNSFSYLSGARECFKIDDVD